ncbi:MAG: sugar kinase [Flavobacteriales bacterium]|jgi:sugar/nucleoside kinase (ribokinase family)|nr:sugar kinase [Flavobacteriales bacterium]|tara:strand:+ start:265 stop:1170 length:906 start_codon:yes stop_codon:yes gene_type:complete
MSLLIVGTVAFDGIETPYGKVDRILGGSATYIGIASSYFNKKSNLISVVGGDFPKDNINLLIAHGINCDGLEIIKNEKTFYWSGKYHENMNLRDTLATHLNVLENFEPKIPDQYQDCKYLMLANLMPSIQLDAIQKLESKPHLVVTDTMNYWMDNYLSDLHVVISKTDVLIINIEEALQLSKSNNLIDAATKIQTMGPKFVIIKKGEFGASLFSNNQSFNCPAFNSLKCLDPTGAGDTFAGAFIGYLNHTNNISFNNMKKGVIRACAMASFCVENFGVQNIINQTPENIKERVTFLEKNNL